MFPKKERLLLTLSTVGLILLFIINAHAANSAFPEVMIILDGSGSMWGQTGKQTKIDAARKVLHELIPSLPEEVKIGLTAYGHREKGRCTDIEIMIPAGSNDREALLEMVDSISPKGKTPIADAIKRVVDTLKTRENETTIIMVSDGEETCNPDPCGVVKRLKETGIKFILHVVGFDVDQMQKEELSCLARNGGGNYFDAADAPALLAAFQTVKKEVVKKVEFEKAKTQTKKMKTGLGKLKVTFPEEGKKSLAHIRIIRTKDNKTIKTAENPAGDSTHPLLSGEYNVVLGYANSNYQKPSEIQPIPVIINPGEVFELGLGTLVFNIADALKNIPASSVTLRSDDKRIVITTSASGNNYYFFTAKPLLPGSYSFEYHYKTMPEPAILARNIIIKPGEQTVLTIDSGIRIKKNEQGLTGFDLIPHASEAPVLQVRKRWDNDYPLWHAFPLSPDTYSILVYLKGMDEALPVAEGVEIEKGQLLEFDTGL